MLPPSRKRLVWTILLVAHVIPGLLPTWRIQGWAVSQPDETFVFLLGTALAQAGLVALWAAFSTGGKLKRWGSAFAAALFL